MARDRAACVTRQAVVSQHGAGRRLGRRWVRIGPAGGRCRQLGARARGAAGAQVGAGLERAGRWT